jgi:hypothetical protein
MSSDMKATSEVVAALIIAVFAANCSTTWRFPAAQFNLAKVSTMARPRFRGVQWVFGLGA